MITTYSQCIHLTVISKNAQLKFYYCARDFQNNALWDIVGMRHKLFMLMLLSYRCYPLGVH